MGSWEVILREEVGQWTMPLRNIPYLWSLFSFMLLKSEH